MIDWVFYILDENHNPVPAPDYNTWYAWHLEGDNQGIANRQVAFSTINGIAVSTIFWGWQLQHDDVVPPFFETRLSSPEKGWSGEMKWRTWDEAKRGHQAICLWLTQKLEAGASTLPPLLEMIKEFKDN